MKGRKSSLPRVVGVGASAGGLEALKQLVAAMPHDAGLAVVVLQHLPPKQHRVLADLLRRMTSLPVIEVETRAVIEPNTILVVPARTCAEMSRGALVARVPRSGVRPRFPIDALFKSLAKVLGDKSIGVVLSGTANDGTEGLRAIREAGGTTIAQEPATAQFDDMPRSAVAAGVADYVMAPDQIGSELGPIVRGEARAPRAAGPEVAGIDGVLDQLREGCGIDFTSYKRTTIERRLERRLGQLHLASLAEYGAYLAKHPEEGAVIYEDLLIHVTEFFRDAGMLDRAISWLADRPRKRADDPVRIWVPGCSTGQEVYSLAILAIERLGAASSIKLFGTDLSEQAIETARIGRYPEAVAASVGPERLARFFHRDDQGYRIRREIRERCVFARHDVVTDPPFSKLDLVSCRNLLIYLGPKLQQRVIPIFHYALAQPGILLLGNAETVGGFDDLFEAVDAAARIYVRKPAPRTSLTFPQAGQLGRQPWRHPPDRLRSTPDVLRDVDLLLLARYGPPCVLIDDNLDVVQFRGRIDTFLEIPAGQPSHNLLRMAREGLGPGLRLAVEQARRTDTSARHEDMRIGKAMFDLEVVPIRAPGETGRHFLVIFEVQTPSPAPCRGKAARVSRADRGEVARLRDELATTRDFLQTRAAQHLAASEELGVANEELQSTNEELQSTNEELQTAKEELQSTNEELETVNDELQRGNADLREANDDLSNVLASVDIAIIIVSTDRRIRRFTPKARTVMSLIPGDLGRPIADLKPAVDVTGLDERIAEVIETLTVHESEVAHADGTTYRMQIRPYRSLEDRIGGAVIAFVDITALRTARDHARAVVEAVPTPLAVLDERLRIVSANHAFRVAFEPIDPIGMGFLELGDWQGELRERLEAAMFRGAVLDDLSVELDGGKRALLISARAMPSIDTGPMLVVGVSDITERRKLELLRAAAQLERESFLDAVSHELRSPLGVILLWTRVIRDLEHGDPRRLQGIETIIEAVQTQSQNVDDLLDLSLARTSRLPVFLRPTNPAPIVRAAVDAAGASAIDKQLTVDVRLEEGLEVMADPRRLQQVVSNLLSNAIKFTPRGGRVSITLERVGELMSLAIRDSGPGIPPELIDRMFEPFSRADTSITRMHAGLGIGLSLVRNLVERHHGTIAAAQPAGSGTLITVRIPILDPDPLRVPT